MLLVKVLIFFFTAFFVSLAAVLLAFGGSFPGWWPLTVSLVAAVAQGCVALRALFTDTSTTPIPIIPPNTTTSLLGPPK